MKEKNIIILVIGVLLVGIICVAAFSFTGTTANNTSNNTTIELNDTNTTNNTTTADSSQDGTGSSKSSSSKSSSSVDVEEQELSYTRDQPTKTENGVTYSLIYGDDGKPSHWEDGQRNVMPLKKNSGSSNSRAFASSTNHSSL